MTKKILFIFTIFTIVALAGCSKQSNIKNTATTNPSPQVSQDQSEIKVNSESTDTTTNNLANSDQTSSDFALDDLRQATLKIDGMFCPSCATGIEFALKAEKGVTDAYVNYGQEKGWVIYNPKLISLNEITQLAKPYTATIDKDEKATATKVINQNK